MPRPKFPPPADFDKESEKLWKDTIKFLEEQNTWEASDVKALERYVRAEQRARCAREELIDSNGRLQLTTHGSQGQLVQNPNVKTAREAERDAHEYAKELLLTPKAREQHELERTRATGGKFGDALT